MGVLDPADEKRICDSLRAFVEEWGPEYVVVSVPENWKSYSNSFEGWGAVRLEFSTVSHVMVSVIFEGQIVYRSGVNLLAV